MLVKIHNAIPNKTGSNSMPPSSHVLTRLLMSKANPLNFKNIKHSETERLIPN